MAKYIYGYWCDEGDLVQIWVSHLDYWERNKYVEDNELSEDIIESLSNVLENISWCEIMDSVIEIEKEDLKKTLEAFSNDKDWITTLEFQNHIN